MNFSSAVMRRLTEQASGLQNDRKKVANREITENVHQVGICVQGLLNG